MILIKSMKDIKGIADACRIVAEVLSELSGFIKEGITTYMIQEFADTIIRKSGAKSAFKGYSVPGLPPFPGSVCTSVNSCIVHGIPCSNTILKNGDIVSVDVGVQKKGYYGDAARTYPVGTISEDAIALMDVTMQALKQGISKARCGCTVGDISNEIGSYVTSKGFYVADSLTGHGVGKKLHEEPMIPNTGIKEKGPLLQKGMTLAIEPMVNIGTNKVRDIGWEFYSADNSLSAHFEHTVLVTEDEPVILTAKHKVN